MADLLLFSCNYTVPPVDISLTQESARRFGMELVTFGEGKSWPGWHEAKLKHAADFLKTRREHLCVWVDSTDTLILADADKIEWRFRHARKFNDKPILVSGEKNCYPDRETGDLFPPSDTPYRWPNAGTWMGERLALIDALEWMYRYDAGKTDCDQRKWCIAARERDDIAIDYHCDVFQCMHSRNPAEIRESDGYNLATGRQACVLHFNGRAENREEMWRSICASM